MANDKDYIKQRTIELYDLLPMEEEARKKQYSIRDEIIELNYKFFGYVASSTYAENASYEDKFQTALMSFLGMWWKYKFAPKYRTDLSFAVFFKPRISEEIKRHLSTISYSQKRSLCLEAASQLGKPWTAICYDDLSKVQLPEDDILALKAILGTQHPQDISDIEGYTDVHTSQVHGLERYVTDKFDSLEELLIQEMIDQESALNDKYLKYLSDLYSIPYIELKQTLPKAMDILHERLIKNQL
jgi:hypothetical protein